MGALTSDLYVCACAKLMLLEGHRSQKKIFNSGGGKSVFVSV